MYRRGNIHSSNNYTGNLGSGSLLEDDSDGEGDFGDSERNERGGYYSQNKIPDPSTPCPNRSARFHASTFNPSQNKRELFPNHQTTLHTPPSTYCGSQSPESPNENIKFQYSMNFNTEQVKRDLIDMRSELHALVDKSIQNILDKLPESFEQNVETSSAMDWQPDPEVVIPQTEETQYYQDVKEVYRGGEEAQEGYEEMGRMPPSVMKTPEMGRRISSEGNHVVGSQNHVSSVWDGF